MLIETLFSFHLRDTRYQTTTNSSTTQGIEARQVRERSQTSFVVCLMVPARSLRARTCVASMWFGPLDGDLTFCRYSVKMLCLEALVLVLFSGRYFPVTLVCLCCQSA